MKAQDLATDDMTEISARSAPPAVRGESPASTETGDAPGSQGATLRLAQGRPEPVEWATSEQIGPYVSEEPRRESAGSPTRVSQRVGVQEGCSAGRMPAEFHHGLLVLKFGGELVQSPSQVAMLAAVVRDWSARGPLVLVHGGGKEIDKALLQSGIEQRRADGLRITDAATLDVVVAVLAGTVNTRIVAGLVAHGVRAVGLTGADGAIGLSVRAPAYENTGGGRVDLELVGLPSLATDVSLLAHLIAGGYVPVVASIGVDAAGQLLNVNADVLAARLAAALGCRRLVIAGTTAGVLDAAGNTMAELDLAAIDRLIAQGTATGGMIAKLRACRAALSDGVAEVLLVDGRDACALAALRGTRLCTRMA